MKEYHKIQSVFLRDPETNYKTLLEGQFATPEFAYLQNCEWDFTEKVDGTNIRIMYDGESVTFGGKTDKAQLPSPLVTHLNGTFLSQKDKFDENFENCNVCLCGEGYGGKIQKGGKYRSDQSFVLFDVWINGWWLKRENVEDIGEMFGIEVVPIIGRGTLADMVSIVRKGFDSCWGNFTAEGIVARPAVELKARNGGRIITKLKTKDFV